jgi:NADP-dependent 3-hydroxy acid dehydrogenase YdfG
VRSPVDGVEQPSCANRSPDTSSGGIGLATAKRLQEEGARVAIAGRSQKTLDEAVKAIGNGVLAVQTEVANLADIDKLRAEVSQKRGKIGVLFVNAGDAKFAPLAKWQAP